MASMATYQLSCSSSRGQRTASGTVFCDTDARATDSAMRLLHNMSDFDTIEVHEGERPVATLQRRDLEAA